MHLVAVVLAGGTGTRLYPASRPDAPKQLRSLDGGPSLLRRTVERATFADATYVLTRPDLVEQVEAHAPGATVLAEPEPKDTGPALVYASHELRERERRVGAGTGTDEVPTDDIVLLCLPSDHHVGAGFESSARGAARVARETGGLVTFGVEPTRAATGYGYVKPGEERALEDGTAYAPVERFTEKPDPGAAARYRERGCYWNAGMFAWRPEALLAAARDSPLAPLVAALESGDPEGGFEAVEPISVDHALLEGADDAYVVPVDFEWDDVGSWDALARVLDADDDGNVVVGDALTVDASGSVVAAGEGQHVSVVGVEDLVVAAYDGRVLVLPERESQRVREVVERLREDGLY